MLDQLRDTARRWFSELRTMWRWEPRLRSELLGPAEPAKTRRRLEGVVLTDGVSRTLFEDYARHRQDVRGDEETGWILMGLRQGDEALALATLPAGAGREAGVAHVRFNSTAQAVAARILRQEDRRLGILGLGHTHPGSLRHPSTGD